SRFNIVKTWMPGTSPGMTVERRLARRRQALRSAPAEQRIEEPVVEATAAGGRCAVRCDRLDRRWRCRPRTSAAAESREHFAARPAGQACNRHTLVRGTHHAAPDFHREASAGHMFGRRSVVIAEPYAGHEMRGEADKPGVAEILAGAGLPGGGPAGQARALRGAIGERFGHHRIHHRDVARLDDAAELRRAARIDDLA